MEKLIGAYKAKVKCYEKQIVKLGMAEKKAKEDKESEDVINDIRTEGKLSEDGRLLCLQFIRELEELTQTAKAVQMPGFTPEPEGENDIIDK